MTAFDNQYATELRHYINKLVEQHGSDTVHTVIRNTVAMLAARLNSLEGLRDKSVKLMKEVKGSSSFDLAVDKLVELSYYARLLYPINLDNYGYDVPELEEVWSNGDNDEFNDLVLIYIQDHLESLIDMGADEDTGAVITQ